MTRLLTLLAASAALCLGMACGSHDDHDHGSGDDGHSHDDAGHSHGDTDAGPGTADGGITRAVSGASAGGNLTVTVEPVTPAVPARGLNTFRFSVQASAGGAASGLTLSVRPWMPDHGHGSNPVPTVTEDPASTGTFTVSNVNFTMAGTWELQATFGGSQTDTFVASFLVP